MKNEVVEMRLSDISDFCAELSQFLTEKNFGERYHVLVAVTSFYAFSEGIARKAGFGNSTWMQLMAAAKPLVDLVLKSWEIDSENVVEKVNVFSKEDIDRMFFVRGEDIKESGSSPLVIRRNSPSKLDS